MALRNRQVVAAVMSAAMALSTVMPAYVYAAEEPGQVLEETAAEVQEAEGTVQEPEDEELKTGLMRDETGIKVYTIDRQDARRRYVKKPADDGNIQKSDAITFVSKEKYDLSDNKILHLMQVMDILRGTEGVIITPVIWKGELYRNRIGKNSLLHEAIRKKAAFLLKEKGIRITADSELTKAYVNTMRDGVDLVFAGIYTCKCIETEEDEEQENIHLRFDRDIIAVKAGRRIIFPDKRSRTCTLFTIKNKRIAKLTAYCFGDAGTIKADICGEDERYICSIELKKETGTEGANPMELPSSPVRSRGKCCIKILRNDKVPYKKSLSTQHITVKTIADSLGELRTVCLNLMFQLVIKDDIKKENISLVDMSPYSGYTFILINKNETAAIEVGEDGTCTFGSPHPMDEFELRFYEAERNEEFYAVKKPDGGFLVVKDTGWVPIPGEKFSAKNFTRAGKESNEELAPFLDFIWYDVNGRQYYTSGWDLIKTNRQSYTYLPKIREIITTDGEPADKDLYFSLLDVPFIWMAQENTVIPFPAKYLREYMRVHS